MKIAAPPEKARTELLPEKVALIDRAFAAYGLRSFADLGGAWGVGGGYTFYAVERQGSASATLVDLSVTAELRERASLYPQVRLIQGDFGQSHMPSRIGRVDALLCFSILLHQAQPDWDTLLERYAPWTRTFLIFNPQWTGSDRTIRLLDLGREAYFRNVPHASEEGPYANLFEKLDQWHPRGDKWWRDAPDIWQWGITDADLVSTMERLGFQLIHREDCGQFGYLENFRNRAFLFRTASPGPIAESESKGRRLQLIGA